MERLWTPWRYSYIAGERTRVECVFCAIAQETDRDQENLVVFRSRLAYVVLNLFPYTSGHLLIVPYDHAPSLTAVSPEVTTEIMRLTREAERHLTSVYQAPGFNLGMNLGQCAGAGVAEHLHMHVLPRWSVDANFMTTVGETRIMPEDLNVTWQRVREAFTKTESSL